MCFKDVCCVRISFKEFGTDMQAWYLSMDFICRKEFLQQIRPQGLNEFWFRVSKSYMACVPKKIPIENYLHLKIPVGHNITKLPRS